MEKLLSMFGGFGTYIAGFGLIGLSVYQLSIQEYEKAAMTFGLGWAAIFQRRATARAAVANAEALEPIAEKVGVPAATIDAKITQPATLTAPLMSEKH